MIPEPPFAVVLPDSVPEPIRSELAAAAAAALAGGAAVRALYSGGDVWVEEKNPGDPVTEADHAANRAIHEVLGESFPTDPILSEESPPPDEGLRLGRLWVVDPLDGTKEFIARNGEFAVMVGFADRGAAVLGAVYQPDPGRLWLGVAAGGAWEADVIPGHDHAPAWRRLALDGEDDPDPIRLTRSRSHMDPRIQRLQEILGNVDVVPSGSVGIKCTLIATDRADLYVHPVPFLKEWDTCAPEAILRGAGGRVTDCAGSPLRYGKPDPRQPRGIFAARVGVFERVGPVVREVADVVPA
jgi:3'(2'), 5'-bisphosphate nucleotidase